MISVFFFFKQKTAYEMRISDWSSDVCSSDLTRGKWAGIDPRVLRGHGQCDENREPIEGRRFDQAFPRRGVQPADPDQPCRHLPLRRQIGRGDADARSGHRWRTRRDRDRSEEHTSELQSLMRITYAVFCLKKKSTADNAEKY